MSTSSDVVGPLQPGRRHVFDAVAAAPAAMSIRTATWSRSDRGRRDEFRRHFVLAASVPHALLSHPISLTADAEGLTLRLERMPGETLQAHFGDPIRRPTDAERTTEVLAIARSLAWTLCHLERAGVIHGAISADQVLWHRPTSTAYLVDLGQGCFLRGAAGAGASGFDEPYGDLRALGELLTWLTTGELPRRGVPGRAADALSALGLDRLSLLDEQWLSLLRRLIDAGVDDGFRSATALKAELDSVGRLVPDARADRPASFHLPGERFGRDREFGLLMEAYGHLNAAADAHEEGDVPGRPLIVFVDGPSGIGKTSTIDFACRTIARRGARVVRGKFNQFGNGQPFWILTNAVDHALADACEQGGRQQEEMRQRIHRGVGTLAGALCAAIPWLARLMGTLPEPQPLSGEAAKARFALALRRLVSAVATPSHPLVMFLDDLQWADGASLELLKTLLLEPGGQNLLVLCAFRTEALAGAPVLQEFIASVRSERAIRHRSVHVDAWESKDVEQLLRAAQLSCREGCAALAMHLVRGSQGNPFAIGQMLQFAEMTGLLHYDVPRRQWDVNLAEGIDAVSGLPIVDLVKQRAARLDAECRQLLCTLAHLGASSPLEWLSAAVAGSSLQTASGLAQGFAQGLIYVEEDAASAEHALVVRFVHDAIQKACHDLETDAHRPGRHLAIGRALLGAWSGAAIPDGVLFAIVEQYGRADEALLGPTEKGALVALCGRAARYARSQGAHREALALWQRALRWLPGEAPTAQARELTLAAAEAAYAAADFDTLDRLIDGFESPQPPLDPVLAARFGELRVLGLLARNQLSEALAVGARTLQMIGHPLASTDPGQPWPPVPRLEDLGSDGAADATIDTALRILVALTPCAFITSFDTYCQVIRSMIELAQLGPASPLTPLSYTNYGLTLSGMGRTSDGYASGDLALAMCQHRSDATLICKVTALHYGFLNHWGNPVLRSVEPLSRNFEECLRCGEQEYLGYTAFLYCDKAWSTGLLDELGSVHQPRTELVRQFGHDFSWWHCRVWLQLVQALSGRFGRHLFLEGESFSETRDIPHLEHSQNGFSLFTAHALRAWLAWHRGDVEACDQACNQADRHAMTGAGTMLWIDFLVLKALLAVGTGATDAGGPADARASTTGDMVTLRRLADSAPMNVRHKWAMVQGWAAAQRADLVTSVAHFGRARAWAIEGTHLHDRALIEELWGESLLRHGCTDGARSWLAEAYGSYLRWGATRVAEALLARHPWLSTEALEAFDVDFSVEGKLRAWLCEFRARQVAVFCREPPIGIVAELSARGMLRSRRTTRLEADSFGITPAVVARAQDSDPPFVVMLPPDADGADGPGRVWVAGLKERGTDFGVALMAFDGDRMLGGPAARTRIQALVQAVVEDLRQQALEERWLHSTRHDQESGLPNRAAFAAQLDHDLVQARASGPSRQQVVLVQHRDADLGPLERGAFRQTSVREELLARARASLPPQAFVGLVDHRTLAFEFRCESPNDRHSVAVLVRQLLDRIEAPLAGGRQLQFGAALIADDGVSDAEQLLAALAAKLNQPRDAGGSDLLFAHAAEQAEAGRFLSLARDLQWALNNTGLRLVYQPIVDMLDERLLGAEALIRWHHPVKGDIPADRIVALAETTGLIRALGRWVTNAFIAQVSEWLTCPLGERLVFGLNASPLELVQPDYAQYLLHGIESAGIAPVQVALEITESTYLEEDDHTLANLNLLSQAGLTLCIDDFGVGTSSLGRLHAVLARRLKIDKSFVQGLPDDKGRRTTVEMIIRLAEALSLDVVAEGVGTRQEVEFLTGEGLRKAQGYFYSPPLEADVMQRLIESGHVPPSA